MFDQLISGLGAADKAMDDLDADRLIGSQPARALQLLAGHERALAATRARLTARAEEMRQWQREGYRSFEESYAATFGMSFGQARKKTRAAKNLNDHQRTADGLANGDISEDEAETVADAAEQNPQAESELLNTAKNKHQSDKDLKDRAAKAKAAGESDEARAARLRRGRRAGWGVDRDGFWTLNAKLQPEVGAEVKARLAAEADRIFAQARKSGTREGHDRYRADAVANLIRGAGPAPAATASPQRSRGDQLGLGLDRPPPEAADAGTASAPAAGPGKELVIDINLETLRRGCLNPGESCTIRGVGPVPVEVARSWVDDAFIKAVIRDGADVKKVVHYGRHVPAHVRTALGVIDQTCTVPGCSNPRVELDHDRPHAEHGPSSVDNLRPLCVHHHRQRTHDGYQLTGEPGDRCWIGPDGRILFADRPHHLTAEAARGP